MPVPSVCFIWSEKYARTSKHRVSKPSVGITRAPNAPGLVRHASMSFHTKLHGADKLSVLEVWECLDSRQCAQRPSQTANTHTQLMISTLLLTVAVAFSDQQSTGLVSYHTPTICTATRVSLLLVRECGTVCHCTYDETLATD